MTDASSSLLLGNPRFGNEAAPLAAWRRAIAAHGIKGAADRAKGPFAVALFDADGTTFLAVDRFSQETLCYRVDGERLIVGARADVVAATGGAVDPQALFDYLYLHAIPAPRTVYRDVQRLPAGHCATFKAGVLTVEPYKQERFEGVDRPDFASLRDEFRALLKAAVEREVDAANPACFLSGGTDSSTVAGMIGEVCGRPAKTFSIGFEAEGYDEMEYARIAARRYGTEHHEYYVTPDDLVRDITHVASSYDQPFGNSSALPAYHCALLAREKGVTRILAGDGGDELFGGNSRYANQRIFDWYQHVPRTLRTGLMEPFFKIGAVSRTPLLKKGSGYIRQANTPLPDRLQIFNLLRRLGFGDVLTPAFMAQIDVDSVLAQQRQVWAAANADHEIDRHLAYDWRFTLAESDLPKVRGTTALAGLEVGFPMLDDDLLAFSLRLPPDYKLKGGRLRWFFKEALRGFLPDEIIAKKKQGFGLPFGVWMIRHDGLRKLATDSLNGIVARGIVQPAFARDLLQIHMPEHPHYYGTMVWILMMMEQWLRQHAPDYRVDGALVA